MDVEVIFSEAESKGETINDYVAAALLAFLSNVVHPLDCLSRFSENDLIRCVAHVGVEFSANRIQFVALVLFVLIWAQISAAVTKPAARRTNSRCASTLHPCSDLDDSSIGNDLSDYS